jgi:molybdate transport system substrate-binding protein
VQRYGENFMANTCFAVTTTAAVSALLLVAATHVASSAEIKILSGSAIEPAMIDLIPKFEQSSGHKVTFDFNGTIGGMTDRVKKGEAADVAIVSGRQIEMLEKEGKIVPGSRSDVAKVGVGVFVRKGAPKPDISSVETFKRAMLAAKSIGWNDPAAGAPVSIYMLGVLERLGIAEEMKPKTTAFKQRSERFEAVARGDVEIGFNQISEILAAPGIDLVGPLPAPIQNYTLFTGGIVASSNAQEAAKSLIRFISSPNAQMIWKTKGFDSP